MTPPATQRKTRSHALLHGLSQLVLQVSIRSGTQGSGVRWCSHNREKLKTVYPFNMLQRVRGHFRAYSPAHTSNAQEQTQTSGHALVVCPEARVRNSRSVKILETLRAKHTKKTLPLCPSATQAPALSAAVSDIASHGVLIMTVSVSGGVQKA